LTGQRAKIIRISEIWQPSLILGDIVEILGEIVYLSVCKLKLKSSEREAYESLPKILKN
jgi:hypothetical protein